MPILFLPLVFLPFVFGVVTWEILAVGSLVIYLMTKGLSFTIEKSNDAYILIRQCWGIKYESTKSQGIGCVCLDDEYSDAPKSTCVSIMFAGRTTYIGTSKNMREIEIALSKYQSNS